MPYKLESRRQYKVVTILTSAFFGAKKLLMLTVVNLLNTHKVRYRHKTPPKYPFRVWLHKAKIEPPGHMLSNNGLCLCSIRSMCYYFSIGSRFCLVYKVTRSF